MKRYLAVVAALLGVLILLFVIFEALQFPLLSDPTPWLQHAGPGTALLGVALLTVDVLVPVPSNVVMVANGALFGFAVGASLSLTGSLGAGALSFAIGRRGGPLVQRLVPRTAHERGEELLRRWGALAIVVTRPLPLLAEVVTILAGTSHMPWRTALGMTLLGSLPAALLYSLLGVAALQLPLPLVVALVLPVAGITWLVGWALTRRGIGTRY
ncbi:TVP38/TMEM64 family protein [Deinococcus peraridilitoris]|uniref:VTT domain-containing protein n=1 Tax=Deinococcus peraridilitoris (strain DSM 19664 / LMG 22246 / CIP 109416 / KR-200) TaxID=937777 RepID=L0A2P6_DEIPD|nr:VTT domain-containing protein [Deinococcus peraridilitoris]AFZ67714.1 hypothetical protein Deipe_2229 [Deinococcus peraridilitoris DSM 19664]